MSSPPVSTAGHSVGIVSAEVGSFMKQITQSMMNTNASRQNICFATKATVTDIQVPIPFCVRISCGSHCDSHSAVTWCPGCDKSHVEAPADDIANDLREWLDTQASIRFAELRPCQSMWVSRECSHELTAWPASELQYEFSLIGTIVEPRTLVISVQQF